MMNSKLYLIVLCSMILCFTLSAQQRSTAPQLQTRTSRPQAQPRSTAPQVQRTARPQTQTASQTPQTTTTARTQPKNTAAQRNVQAEPQDDDFDAVAPIGQRGQATQRTTSAQRARDAQSSQRGLDAQKPRVVQKQTVEDEFADQDDWDIQSIVPVDERPAAGWQLNAFKDNWFMSFGVGAQWLNSTDDLKGDVLKAITFAPSLTIGKNMSPSFGFRFNFTGGSLHGYNDGLSGTYRRWESGSDYYLGYGAAGTPGYPADPSVKFLTWDPRWNSLGATLENGLIQELDGQYVWVPGLMDENRKTFYMQHVRYMAINAALTVNMVTLFQGYDPNRKFEVSPFAGPTFFHIFEHQGTKPMNAVGINAGIQASLKLGKRWGAFFEGTANVYPDDFDGQRGGGVGTNVLQATAGLTLSIGKPFWQVCDNTDYELLDRLNREINDLRNRPCCPLIEPKPPVANPIVSFVEPAAEAIKKRANKGEAYLVFQVARSILLPNLGNNTAELGKIIKSIDYVKEEPEVTVDGISITGYASPEGQQKANEKLSEDRAKALKDHVKLLYRFDESIFSVHSNGENWDGLVKLMGETSLSEREKSDITDIIRNTDNVVSRKNKIKSYAGGRVYKYLLADIYPKLRRTDYEISYTVPHFSLARGRELIKTKPTMLSLNEMYVVANSYDKKSPEFRQAIETALTLYPNDVVANINAAALAIQNNEISRAEGYLDKVKTYPQAYGNLGVLYMISRRYDEAQRYLQMAADGGNQVAAQNLQGLKELLEQMKDYESELESYNNEISSFKEAMDRNKLNEE